MLGMAGMLFALRPAASQPGVTRENFQVIRRGMSEEKVQALIGTEATDDICPLGGCCLPGEHSRLWEEEECKILIHFWVGEVWGGALANKDGSIVPLPPDQGVFDCLRRLLQM
jgi:hypothetical protein